MVRSGWLFAAGALVVVVIVLFSVATPRDAEAQVDLGALMQVSKTLTCLDGRIVQLVSEETDRFEGCSAWFNAGGGVSCGLVTDSHRLQTMLETATVEKVEVRVFGYKYLMRPTYIKGLQGVNADIYRLEAVVLLGDTG